MKKNYRFYRPAYTLLSFGGLIGLLAWLIIMPSPRLFTTDKLIRVLGTFIAVPGFALMILCIQKYFLSLSGLKTLVNEQHSNELIITGVHRHIRHPLYLGTFAFIWGLWLWIPTLSFLISNSIITVYTLIGIGLEEKKLVLEFGEQYLRYQKEVPRLLPGLIKKDKKLQ